MNAIIVYDSQFGNTERIAHAIADALYSFGLLVRVARVDPEHPLDCHKADLLILGAPTQGFRATPAMLSFIEKTPFALLQDLSVVCFDTRIHGPWGSAARHIARRLRAKGMKPLLSPASFYVKGTQGPLIEGEEERAARWASDIIESYRATQQPLVAR